MSDPELIVRLAAAFSRMVEAAIAASAAMTAAGVTWTRHRPMPLAVDGRAYRRRQLNRRKRRH